MRTIGAVIFPGFELLDLFGPLEMFGMLREQLSIRLVAEGREAVPSAQGPRSLPDEAFTDGASYDILLVPGGRGARKEIDNPFFMDDQALEFFAWGARSWVCAGSNFAPEAHIALWRACAVQGDFNKGRRIMSAMLPLMRVLEQGGKFVQCIKHGLSLRGLPVGPPRRPLQPLNKDEKRALAETVKIMT